MESFLMYFLFVVGLVLIIKGGNTAFYRRRYYRRLRYVLTRNSRFGNRGGSGKSRGSANGDR